MAMAELDGLKKKVELIDLRLKTAHSARERESAALVEIWEKIRQRFQDQAAEISKLRNQVADLEDTRDELMKMVQGLLAAVEGGLESMADETVPHIKSMAGQLLADSQDDHAPPRVAKSASLSDVDYDDDDDEPAAAAMNGASFHDDLLSAIERSVNGASEADFVDELPRPVARAPVARKDGPATASPGIRNLVARIENAVGEDFLDPPFAKKNKEPEAEPEDDLARDLREIEALRNELHGLRNRISAGAL